MIVFEKKQGNLKDVLFINLKHPSNEEFCFRYERGEMRSFSTNEQFENSIKEISTSNRRLEGRPIYKYSFSTEAWWEKERGKYQSRYKY